MDTFQTVSKMGIIFFSDSTFWIFSLNLLAHGYPLDDISKTSNVIFQEFYFHGRIEWSVQNTHETYKLACDFVKKGRSSLSPRARPAG